MRPSVRNIFYGVGARRLRRQRHNLYVRNEEESSLRSKLHYLQWHSMSSSSSSFASGSNNEGEDFFDVVIVGGGVVGSSTANLLRKKAPDLKVAMIDSRKEPPSTKQISGDGEGIPNPRSYALSPRSITEVIGNDTIIQNSTGYKVPIGYYQSMQVWQDSSPASLTFTTRDLDPDPQKCPYLGGCVEDHALVAALWNDLVKTSATTKISDNSNGNTRNNVEIICNESIRSLDTGDLGRLASITTSSGRTIQSCLLVGADGGNSFVRKQSGISRIGGDYNQYAITFTVELEEKDEGHGSDNDGNYYRRAYQRYLSDGGPMALLPTYSPKHAVIVWSTSPDVVSHWKNNPNDNECVRYLNDCLQDGPQRIPPLIENAGYSSSKSTGINTVLSNLMYGAERVFDTVHYGLATIGQYPEPKFQIPPKIKSIASSKFVFPLSCYQATTYVKGRTCLVGDSAHTVHPMAGQGLNLGLADVDTLVNDCVLKSYFSGMDVSTFLYEYNTNRHREVSISLGGIHTLQQLFGNTRTVPIQHIKSFGMNIIQNFSPLRRKIASAAAHGV